MTLFIHTDSGNVGSGSIFPDRASEDLFTITNLDAGYGEAPGPAPNLIQITYVRVETGVCPQRLDQLVNTDFAGTAGSIDIVVVAADTFFTANDGELLTGAFTLAPNAMAGSVNLNPNESVLVVYDVTDNAGTGICADREGGGADLDSPSSVILYHELSHAMRICTNAQLDLEETDCANASEEESEAITDENDLRNQLGIGRRQPGNHCGTPGCRSTPTCCVVASVACGSPFASEVNSLRYVRDRLLRKSEIGFDFFDRLHMDYYQFSPAVVDMMSTDPELRRFVRSFFVRPLVSALELLYAHVVDRVSSSELVLQLDEVIRHSPEIAELGTEELATIGRLISSHINVSSDAEGPNPTSTYVSATTILSSFTSVTLGDLASLIEARALSSAYVKWALVDTLAILVKGLELRKVGNLQDGQALAATINEWTSQMPISKIWPTLSRYELAEEIEFMRRTLLREPFAQREFARRLLEAFPDDASIIDASTALISGAGS